MIYAEIWSFDLPPYPANHCTLTTPYEGAAIAKVYRCNILKNSEIHSIEGAVCSISFTAPFLHTRSFNILRRLGSGVKRKSSENQWFSELFCGLIDPLVTPERYVTIFLYPWLSNICIWRFLSNSLFLHRQNFMIFSAFRTAPSRVSSIAEKIRW